jgi:putative endonuclease
VSEDGIERPAAACAKATAGADRRPNDSTRPRTAAQASGEHAEALAAEFLAGRGLRIVARNFRVKGGELDLVAEDGRTLVFVEVRLRSNARFGGAGESITATKRRRVVLAARCFLASRKDYADRACRFDCVLLNGLNSADEPVSSRIEWIRDAFPAE